MSQNLPGIFLGGGGGRARPTYDLQLVVPMDNKMYLYNKIYTGQ